jgi:hypothetical protein
LANISTKELNYIKDFLSWELYMAKLCRQYASQMAGRGFGQMLGQAGQAHQQNYTGEYTADIAPPEQVADAYDIFSGYRNQLPYPGLPQGRAH